jgi:hypothetical protein
VAIKMINKSQIISELNETIQSTIQEIRVHWELESCKNILRLIAIFEDECNISLVLEY